MPKTLLLEFLLVGLALHVPLSVPLASPVSSRRRALADAALAAAAGVLAPAPSRGIINGEDVSLGEAAAAGQVGLWIDLAGCSICRHDLPATCSGTLVAPDLVLSAKHCIDIPNELNGTLLKVVFSNDVFDQRAPTAAVDRYVRTSDLKMDTKGGDLMLIKLKEPAPLSWQPQSIDLNLASAVDKQASLTDAIGLPELITYGYGDVKDDSVTYSSGVLHKLRVKVISPIAQKEAVFFTKPTAKSTGTCQGDSGGASFFQAPKPLPGGQRQPNSEQVITGVLSGELSPGSLCADSNSVFINPDTFSEFIVRASRELGSPIDVKSRDSWLRFLNTGAF